MIGTPVILRDAISIHALHEESDVLVSGSKVLEWYFNPRSP